MAVNDSVGFQQFSKAAYPVPDPKEAEENVAIALNLKDGQKSLGQSSEDPYTRALSYIEEHRITEVFQNITSKLAFQRPEDPLQFMLEEITRLKETGKLEDLK